MKEISVAWKDAEPQVDEHIGFFHLDTASNALERFGTRKAGTISPDPPYLQPGMVESVLVDPAQCEATGPGLTSACVGKRANFMVFVRDGASLLCVHPTFVLLMETCTGKGRLARHRRIKIKVRGPTGDIDARLAELPTGAYEVNFQPVASGDHEIAVQVQGKHVQRSPFRVCMSV